MKTQHNTTQKNTKHNTTQHNTTQHRDGTITGENRKKNRICCGLQHKLSMLKVALSVCQWVYHSFFRVGSSIFWNATLTGFWVFDLVDIFSCGHARKRLYTLPLWSISPSVRWSIRHIFVLQVVFASLPLPNHPLLSCRVSGLVSNEIVL